MKEEIRKLLAEDYQVYQGNDGVFYCSMCDEPITEIENGQEAYNTFSVSLDGDGDIQYEMTGEPEPCGVNEMLCGKCKMKIGKWDEEVAAELLKKGGA
jgi:hypothetical protein